jgi:hypothetical protein
MIVPATAAANGANLKRCNRLVGGGEPQLADAVTTLVTKYW